ncbi:MAG: NfeD family protein [Rubrivivax sp.]|jgi:membrane protein implicated in regulation of membrane protease activity|nr:NfeD family protein [Rubrivivax sp.]
MDFSAVTLWWLLAGVLVIAELLTGSFYLLMLALGAGAGALAAHAGLLGSQQVVAAAVMGGGATALWHWRRAQAPRSAPAASNPDVNLDIGQRVTVLQWEPDGSTRVQYRGAAWTARLAPQSGPPGSGEHTIVALRGNQLELAPASPHPSAPPAA